MDAPRPARRITLARPDDAGRALQRSPCDGAELTIGRENGDVRFPDHPSLAAHFASVDGT